MLDAEGACRLLGTSPAGLSADESQSRLKQYGPNLLATDGQSGFIGILRHAILNPLVMLLTSLVIVSIATSDYRAATVMSAMIVLGAGLNLIHEGRAGKAAAKLKAMISLNATVVRNGQPLEIAISQLVPGDIVQLAASDMVPADLQLIVAKDLFVMQSSLTGESLPVEKFETEQTQPSTVAIELTCIAFLGTSVESGSATGVVVATGREMYLGGMAETLLEQPEESAFDKGIAKFTWLILRFVLVMVPLVFLINGFTKGNWSEAFFFAIAVAVGLTPEMLPMIVSV